MPNRETNPDRPTESSGFVGKLPGIGLSDMLTTWDRYEWHSYNQLLDKRQKVGADDQEGMRYLKGSTSRGASVLHCHYFGLCETLRPDEMSQRMESLHSGI